MTDHIDTAKVLIRTWAEQQPAIRRVYLFGSRLRGTDKHGQPVKPTSDIDIAVEMTFTDPDEAYDAYMDERWLPELQRLLPWPIDLQWFHPRGTPNVASYLADCSEVIFERR